MRFMMIVKHAEKQGPPPKQLMDAIAKLAEEEAKAGTMLGSGGLGPTALGARVRLTAGKVTVAEVEHLVQPGDLNPDHIITPGVYVKRIVHVPNATKHIEQRTVRRVFDPYGALQIDHVRRRSGDELGLIESRQVGPLLVEPFDLHAGIRATKIGELLLEELLLVRDVPGEVAQLSCRLRA